VLRDFGGGGILEFVALPFLGKHKSALGSLRPATSRPCTPRDRHMMHQGQHRVPLPSAVPKAEQYGAFARGGKEALGGRSRSVPWVPQGEWNARSLPSAGVLSPNKVGQRWRTID